MLVSSLISRLLAIVPTLCKPGLECDLRLSAIEMACLSHVLEGGRENRVQDSGCQYACVADFLNVPERSFDCRRQSLVDDGRLSFADRCATFASYLR